MRVVLINPPPFKIQEPFYDTPPYPSTALAFLAAYLRNAGIEVHIMDCKYDRIDMDESVRLVKNINPDLVGFKAFTMEIIQAGKFASLLKAWKPGIVTVVGGVHVSSIPEETLREFPDFDFGVIGEGEETLLELVQKLMQKEDPSSIPGICSINGEDTFTAGPPREMMPADKIPVPAWDLYKPAKQYYLHSQRGCPFHCPFCANPAGRTIRSTPVEALLDEIQHLHEKYGTNNITFGDEIFTVKRKRTIAFCNGLVERGLHKNIKWWCTTHIRSIDYELATIMKNAGCYLVGLGIESGDAEKLKQIDKGTSVELIMEVTSKLKKAKLDFEAYFILGQPDETVKSALDTINFAVKINPPLPVFGIMIPFPGTKIWDLAVEGKGGYILRSKNWNDYNKQLGRALDFKGVSYKTLENLQLLGYIKVVLWNWRIMDFFELSWEYRVTGLAFLARSLKQIIPKKNSNTSKDM